MGVLNIICAIVLILDSIAVIGLIRAPKASESGRFFF